MPGNFALIDLDTPQDAYTKASYMNPNDQWDLVFSDEFNLDGRTFYPGDDPYWEAVCNPCLVSLLRRLLICSPTKFQTDLHYWQTVNAPICIMKHQMVAEYLHIAQNDLEWYDPSAATTKDGALKLTLSKVTNVLDNHNMQYRSGMVRYLFYRLQ